MQADDKQVAVSHHHPDGVGHSRCCRLSEVLPMIRLKSLWGQFSVLWIHSETRLSSSPEAEIFMCCIQPTACVSADKEIPRSESEPSAEGGFSLWQVKNLKSVFWTKPAEASWTCELRFALFYQLMPMTSVLAATKPYNWLTVRIYSSLGVYYSWFHLIILQHQKSWCLTIVRFNRLVCSRNLQNFTLKKMSHYENQSQLENQNKPIAWNIKLNKLKCPTINLKFNIKKYLDQWELFLTYKLLFTLFSQNSKVNWWIRHGWRLEPLDSYTLTC